MTRRLLVPVSLVFLVLLILGSLAPSDSTRTDTAPTTAPPAGGPPPHTVEATLPPNDEVQARVGDLVTLTVQSDAPGGVEMPDFGESQPVAPGAPAMFDVLPSAPGRFPVVSTDTGKQLGVLVVQGEAEGGGAAAKPDDPT
jgi:hypothetical protein